MQCFLYLTSGVCKSLNVFFFKKNVCEITLSSTVNYNSLSTGDSVKFEVLVFSCVERLFSFEPWAGGKMKIS